MSTQGLFSRLVPHSPRDNSAVGSRLLLAAFWQEGWHQISCWLIFYCRSPGGSWRFVTGGTCCSGGKIWMSDCTPIVTVHRVWKIPMPGKISWSSNCVHRFCWRVSPSSHSSKAIIFKPQNIFESLFELVSWMLYEMPKFSEALTAIDYFAVQTGICWHKPGSNTSPWSTKEKTYCFKFSLAYFII